MDEEEGISGGWHVFIRLSLHCLAKIESLLNLLPAVEKKAEASYLTRIGVGIAIDNFLSDVAPYVNHITYFNEILGMLIKYHTPGLVWTKESIVALTDSCLIPPFWYTYEEGLDTLQHLLETVKQAAASAASTNQAHRVGKDSPLISLAYGGAKALYSKVTEDQHQVIMRLHKEANIQVLKTMWCLPEDPIVQRFLSVTFPSILMSISAFVPRSEEEGGPIRCQFISNEPFTFNMPQEAVDPQYPAHPKSQNIGKPTRIFLNFHGGGFVSGTPHTHETYLREWAKDSKCLIVSVDYKLAPEKQFPFQVEECTYVYKWLVDNNPWGIKPSEIVLGGDSAGGNLSMTTTMNIILNHPNLPVPDGILMAYPALDLTYTVTTSRAMFLNDVLVPYCFLEKCLEAYTEGSDTRNPLVSPLWADDDLLKKLPHNIVILNAGLDPLLDDGVKFAHKCRKLGVPVVQKTYELLPHGYLNFASPYIPYAWKAKTEATEFLRTIFETAERKKNL
eukprot:TRINITY_DN4677_c0_g1_i2.p1 TRINITY_DN4677_c0_g1~~TRINITY_DN4677_c0_g1_i2.p1  ORF type:complete len:504 (-),score=90.36 TRINITY_DN4677_c0_g1_i2:76-1587(-)